METASSEPAWVSMAKLKQKGFQDHPLAKEHKAEEKAVTKVDQEEVMLHERESCTRLPGCLCKLLISSSREACCECYSEEGLQAWPLKRI